MGTEIFVIGDGSKAAQLLVTAHISYTSVIAVQGHQHLNVGIRVGDAISDILSGLADYYSYGAVSALGSVFSGTITLQRRMPEEDTDFHWRTVAEWTIDSASADEGGSESITATADPETAEYRLGVKSGDYSGGCCTVRLGTS
jgi:hypothetical protein